MSFRKTLLAATLLSLPMAATANAQSWDPRVQGIYIGAGLGTNYLDTADGDRTSISFEWGWAGVLSVGYGFGNGLRLELEGNYRNNDVDTIKVNGVNTPRAGGTATTWGLMVNALYDFNLGPVLPYVGVGAGYAWHDYDSVGFRQNSGGNSGTVNVGGTNGAFAYQAILGLAFPIQAVPGLALTAEGRFFGTANEDIDGRANGNFSVNGQAYNARESVKFPADNYNWSLLFGVRYNFGRTAAPVAAPVVAPPPARTFLVFFDWNRDNLTDRARQIIAEAAQASRTQQVTRLEVNGYTDTSGSAQYNMGLSIRRANNVAAELVRLGIPRNQIVARGFGETNLLVPTPDNTREPQNRRVEIILR
ncbi:OmpA family protein [Roseomonas sp. HJA6]|uniref:OmpA family protein n=1 Tax=Roseomonas alba TaxID=2846776 RepID=A0ABS7AIV1_9PROT|nr:OmpA family protein [Neoroseomonas alba]MBW6401240.1 OmpA family protein [Neoroseomonas alba]